MFIEVAPVSHSNVKTDQTDYREQVLENDPLQG